MPSGDKDRSPPAWGRGINRGKLANQAIFQAKSDGVRQVLLKFVLSRFQITIFFYVFQVTLEGQLFGRFLSDLWCIAGHVPAYNKRNDLGDDQITTGS